MKALKFQDITVYPVLNAEGKRETLSPVVIRMVSKNKSLKPLTLPVKENGKPVKVKKEFFIDLELTGGFEKAKIDHVDGVIKSIWFKAFEALKLYGMDYPAIKRFVYPTQDPTISIHGQQEYHPDTITLLKKLGQTEMQEDILEYLVNKHLGEEGITKDHPEYNLARKYVIRNKIYHHPEIVETITENELDNFNAVIKEDKKRKREIIPVEPDQEELEELKLNFVLEKRKGDLPVFERFKQNAFNDKNIFELFAWCKYSRIYNKAKDEYKRRVPESYDPILISLFDYRINAKPKEHIRDLNFDWVQDFLIYLYKNGSVKNIGQKTKNFNPYDYKADLFRGAREPYKINGYNTKVKEIKRYLSELKEAKYLKVDDFWSKGIEAKDFHNFKSNQDYEAKYFIHPKVFEKIATARLLDEQLSHTRDLFVCQVLLGGVSPVDFYDLSKMKFRNSHSDELIIKFHRQKTGGKIVNPILKPVVDICKKYGGQLPPPIKAKTRKGMTAKNAVDFSDDIYRNRLRLLFEIVVPNEIYSEDIADMTTGSYRESEPIPLYKKISPIFARSTAVVLMYSLGVPVNVIIGFTGHKKAEVFYKHYFAILQEDKKKFANEALTKMFGKIDLSKLVA